MKIYKYPDTVLKKKSIEVQDGDKLTLRAIVKEMYDTMVDNNGLGLAAPQVGISKRFFIIQMPESDELMVFINPELELKGELIDSEEGCLSLPGLTAVVKRHSVVKVSFYDLDFKPHSLEVDGLLAIAIQHENDHLDGILYIDHLSETERKKVLENYNPEA